MRSLRNLRRYFIFCVTWSRDTVRAADCERRLLGDVERDRCLHRRHDRQPQQHRISRELVDAGRQPVTHNGGAGSGQPWTSQATPPRRHRRPAAPTTAAAASRRPAFGPYKDITISMNWNTNVISTQVTGTLQGADGHADEARR